MKIIFTTDTIHRGGKERQIFIITQQLLKRAYDVFIISLKYAEQNYLDEYEIDSKRIIIIKSNSRKQIYRELKDVLSTLHPDIIISWDSKTVLFSLLISKKYGFEFINASVQHGIRLFKRSHFMRTLICHLSPNVMANSLTGLKANNLRPGKKRFVLYNGIEKKFKNTTSQKSKEKLKKKIIPGYSKNPGKIFISVANLVPYKDYFTVLNALKEIRSSYNFYYLILGDGPLKNEIERKIYNFQLHNNIILFGKVNDVKKYLNISDYMIHSSRGEGVSNAILEGMYTGLPIITTKVGGTPEIVFPKSSVLFKYKDGNSLTNILLNIDNYFLEFNPKSKEYQNHLKKFSVSAMLISFEKIIESVMNDT